MPAFDTVLAQDDLIEIWARPCPDHGEWRVEILDAKGGRTELAGSASDDYRRASHRIAAPGPVTVRWADDDTQVSLAYAYGNRVLQDGVRLLWTTPRNANDGRRYQLHLQPPWGWMNDPNGMIEIGGVTHAFYQHYPHSRRWNTMHWGHACSANLVDWVHLPIFLDPRPELLADDAKVGGAFSGSAIVRADGSLRLFYTDRQDDREPNWEWQMLTDTADLLTPAESRAVVRDRPPLPGFRRDMRDPYVFRGPDGRWKMLLGGGDDAGGLVLLYETADPEAADGWTFIGPLHAEPMRAGIPVECPCMIALEGEGEGLWVLFFGLIGARDEISRRRNMSYALVGRFDGQRFHEIARREADFATDAYAFQSFRHGQHGPIAMAWAANWTDVFKDRDFPSAMTFPRRLLWRDGRLLTPPVETVAELRQDLILNDPAALAQSRAQPLALPQGLAEIELELTSPGATFSLELTHPTHHVALVSTGTSLELQFDPPGTRTVPRYAAEEAAITRLRIFVDTGLIEIYADDGRWCATKRLDSDEPFTGIRFHGDADAVGTVQVWTLRPAGSLPQGNSQPEAKG
ncbi:MAG: GH32 C-terminal domain-containing protein [Paracoccus sp. (in: a-proteobacteria)]|uniref:GH32 C-terminal domain-containing protein n=1 Tax=Paracoccus sp. TaxID=267 RepID=UPI0039E583E1